MLPLEVFLRLLDEERAEIIEMAENPSGRDAFSFGVQSGMFQAVGRLREKINKLVEDYNNQESEQ